MSVITELGFPISIECFHVQIDVIFYMRQTDVFPEQMK
jgi:hypothetical protein